MTFARQYDAFHAFDELPAHQRAAAKVFSYEAASTGKRHFLLSDVDTFYEEFNGIQEDHRHVYELIRESFPCRLYFDLEFSIAANPLCCGEDMTSKWINLVLWKVYQRYHLTAGDGNVLVLDSCTEDKFSKHVHLLLTGTTDHHEHLFANNMEVGNFVQSIVQDITIAIPGEEQLEAKPEYEAFWVHPPDGSAKKVLFVDLGVYTRNRAFRLFNCCKYGKSMRLHISQRDARRYPLLRAVAADRFPIRRVLAWTFIIPTDILSASTSSSSSADAHADKKQRTAAPAIANHDEELLLFDDFVDHFNAQRYSILPPIQHDQAHALRGSCSHHGSFVPSSSSVQYHKKDKEVARSHYARQGSLFPSLDEFVLQCLASRGGVQGYIQSWHLIHQPNGSFPFYKLRYQIAHNRYCEAVGRMHKSNGIFFDVNLMAQEVSQGCYDVDCRSFKFSILTVPPTALPLTVEEVAAAVKVAYNHDLQMQDVGSHDSQHSDL